MLEDSTSQIGSGALPTEELPTVVIAIEHPMLSATAIAKKFRVANPPSSAESTTIVSCSDT